MKHITMIFLMSLLGTIAMGQTNLYSETQTFHENGHTYQCNVRGIFADLYNTDYKWEPSMQQRFKATGEPFYLIEHEKEPLTTDGGLIYDIGEQKVKDILSKYDPNLKEERGLRVEVIVNTETGKIQNVFFTFPISTPFAKVPVSVYREIELALVGMQNTLTPFGKTLNYIYMCLTINTYPF